VGRDILIPDKLEVSSIARPRSGSAMTIVSACAPAETHTVSLATCSPSSLTASGMVRQALTGPYGSEPVRSSWCAVAYSRTSGVNAARYSYSPLICAPARDSKRRPRRALLEGELAATHFDNALGRSHSP
jgi:hypothetical protein